jgi:predicted small lipoprotein YifL
MVPASLRSLFVIRTDRLFSRLILAGALAAAVAVGGCGRKGPLDAPPGGASAVSQGDQTAGGPEQMNQAGQQSSQTGVIDRGGPSGLPRVRGENKRIPLDVLLN